MTEEILKSTVHLRENNELYIVIGLKHFFMKKGMYQRFNIKEITGIEVNLENIFDAYNNLEKENTKLKDQLKQAVAIIETQKEKLNG